MGPAAHCRPEAAPPARKPFEASARDPGGMVQFHIFYALIWINHRKKSFIQFRGIFRCVLIPVAGEKALVFRGGIPFRAHSGPREAHHAAASDRNTDNPAAAA